MTDISVVVPIHNVEVYLRTCEIGRASCRERV